MHPWITFFIRLQHMGVWSVDRCRFRRFEEAQFSTGSRYRGPPPGHDGFGPYAATFSANGVALFRNPVQRMLSGLRTYHSHPECGNADCRKDVQAKIQPEDYANAVRGCQIKMLTRDTNHKNFSGHPCGGPTPTVFEYRRAVALLPKFQFVGITDEWMLTVCLWHHMFSSPKAFSSCRLSRPVENRTLPASLEGYEDRMDGGLYEAAVDLFWKALDRASLTRAKCEQWTKTYCH